MVYDWDRHQQTCYRLYIDEGRPLEDIRAHLKSVHGFAPSKRAFQAQFRRWNFPPKQRPAHANDRLVSRVKELWEKNLAQRDMLRVLNEEDGFNIKARELMRLRTRNRWLLRAPNGERFRSWEPEGSGGTVEQEPQSQDSTHAVRNEPESFPNESDHGKRNRRRRRRRAASDDRAGLNARFPSETTLDQARHILGLDPATYRTLRSTFRLICHQEGVSKKTLAGAEGWETVKARLVRDLPQLQTALWTARDHPEPGKLALDVICTDVTKRMRNLETRMTLAEAKNALGVNPEESRDMRADLHRMLSESSLKCKSEASPQQWEDLKRRWSDRSILVQRIMEGVNGDPDSRNKVRALEVVARDVMKRIRDGKGRVEQRSTQQPSLGADVSSYGERATGSDKTMERQGSPAEGLEADLGDDVGSNAFDDMSEVSHTSQVAFSPASSSESTPLDVPERPQALSLATPRETLPQAPVLESSLSVAMGMESQMESSLLLGAHAPPDFIDEPYVHPQYASTASPASVFSHIEPVSSACAVYFRLHPSSSFMASAGLWIATLDTHSVEELRDTAVERFPGTICVRVEGILKDGKGRELPLQIGEDQELSAYLAHLQGAAPTFSVQLVWKTS
ncbi:clr5 domain-containing protein [Hirsutella rhossiliensis]|uniref:Clr5 domain-containing protein n=1 Tax=Hirsutella rhossiliensis TaxID=111463 RepID=A0A9P8SHQ1_9HYPO|nr:clr5 domain-containing protein [Hirsutella rhossiliensis]KAH0962389.1 clr5 domain-containing protein [Hirsutella rhossiliensis]